MRVSNTLAASYRWVRTTGSPRLVMWPWHLAGRIAARGEAKISPDWTTWRSGPDRQSLPWLSGALRQDGLPVICLDARHAAPSLAMVANKTDRNDAAGLAQFVRTGWFRQVHVRPEPSYIVRARLAARTMLARQRCEVDNQIRGLLETFGILVGKAPGGLRKRAAEIAGDELANQPELTQLVRMLLALREMLCDQIAQRGQLDTSAKVLPSSSTTQIAVIAYDTSSPT